MINNSYICNSNSIVEGCLFKRHLPNNSRRTSTLEATIGLYNYMKQVEGFEDYYVDELGNVYSNKWGKLNRMILSLDKDGYFILGFRKPTIKNKFNKKVHRLVAEAFIPNPENKPQVNHKNGDKTDNRVCNLEWCTAKENMKHAIQTGLSNTKGEMCGTSKLTEAQILLIRCDLRLHRIIAEEYNVSRPTITEIKLKRTWKHIN